MLPPIEATANPTTPSRCSPAWPAGIGRPWAARSEGRPASRRCRDGSRTRALVTIFSSIDEHNNREHVLVDHRTPNAGADRRWRTAVAFLKSSGIPRSHACRPRPANRDHQRLRHRAHGTASRARPDRRGGGRAAWARPADDHPAPPPRRAGHCRRRPAPRGLAVRCRRCRRPARRRGERSPPRPHSPASAVPDRRRHRGDGRRARRSSHGRIDRRPRTVANGRLVQASTLQWSRTDLTSLARAPAAPLLVGNDATLAGLAEARTGAARGAATALHLTVVVGIGGALIIDGDPRLRRARRRRGVRPSAVRESTAAVSLRGTWLLGPGGRWPCPRQTPRRRATS